MTDTLSEKIAAIKAGLEGKTLTSTQLRALLRIHQGTVDPQSMGGFSGGYHPKTSAALERLGLIERGGGWQSSANHPDQAARLGVELSLTEAGRTLIARVKALEGK